MKDEIRSVYVDAISNIQNKSLTIACSNDDAIWIGDVDNSIHIFFDPCNGTAWLDTDILGKILFCPNQG